MRPMNPLKFSESTHWISLNFDYFLGKLIPSPLCCKRKIRKFQTHNSPPPPPPFLKPFGENSHKKLSPRLACQACLMRACHKISLVHKQDVNHEWDIYRPQGD